MKKQIKKTTRRITKKMPRKREMRRRWIASVLTIAIIAAELIRSVGPTPALAASSWKPALLVNTEAFQIIDDNDSTANIVLKFGETINKSLSYERTLTRFKFDDDLYVTGNTEATGILSGATLYGTKSLRSSGSLVFEGAASGSSLYLGQKLEGAGLTNCLGSNKLLWNSTTGRFSCAADETGGTGGVLRIGDDRYVNDNGDTMTGTLNIDILNGTRASRGLNAINTASGANVHGEKSLTSSGSLSVDGTMSGNSLTVSGGADFDGTLIFGDLISDTVTVNAGSWNFVNATNFATSNAANALSIDTDTFSVDALNNRIGIRTTTPDNPLEVVGTISGSFVRVTQTLSASGAAVFEGSLTGATLAGFGLTNCQGSNKLLWNSSTGKFSCAADEGGTGGGISMTTADARYIKQQGGTMTGTLNIDVTTSDLVKTSSGRSVVTDFAYDASATFLNVVSANDALTIADGGVPNGGLGTLTSPSNPSITTQAAVGAGGMTIIRDDGQYIIIHGNTLATASRWDGNTSGAMSASATNPVNSGTVGAGAIALRRPDGRYLVMHGASAATSALFDPNGITATAAGPAITSCTATTGTNAFLLGSGTYVIMCGGSGNWGVYNPTTNVYTPGTALGVNFGAGAHALQREDGTFLVFSGGNTSTHWIYNSNTNAWKQTPIATNAPTITTGAFSIRRTDGRYLVVGGAQNASTIYDPSSTTANWAGTFTAQSGAGQGPTVALGDGAGAIRRQDGKYFLVIGAGSTATNIIDPGANGGGAGQFIAGPSLAVAPGAGSHMFMWRDGKVQIMRGGATTTTDTYDTGYVIGGPSTSTGSVYTSECMVAPALSTGSRLNFTVNAEDTIKFEVRTGNGSCSSSYKYIRNSGDQISPGSNHNRVQVRVTFQRGLPKFADQEWGLRRGLSQTQYRRIYRDPTVYDFSVNNTTALHRTQFDFGNSVDPSGPINVNIANNKDKNLQIALALSTGYGTTFNATNGYLYTGAFVSHSVLPTTAGQGTIVLKRPDGKFVLIGGIAAPNSNIYDPSLQLFTSNSAVPNGRTGSGALAFKRPDGKFVIVHGAGSKETDIYDPVANTFTAGPYMLEPVGEGALPLPLPNGRVLVLHGGFKKTSTLYDPFSNTASSGAMMTVLVGRGSIGIPRPDGTWLVIPGTSTQTCTPQTATALFNPYNMQFIRNTAAPVVTGTGPGAHAFERSDGQWVIIKGGATALSCAAITTINVYNPFTNRMWASAAAATTPGRGGYAMPRPDGSFAIVQGGNVTTSSIYYEKSGTFVTDSAGAPGGLMVAGPALLSATGTGGVAFQRDDGQYVIISGATNAAPTGTTTAQLFDAGWVSNGYYRSEALNIPDMDSSSTLSWKAVPSHLGISAEVRTATGVIQLQKASSRDITAPGTSLGATTGEKWLQVAFNFKRTFPSYGTIWTDVWYNGGTANNITQRQIAMPTVTEYSVGKDKDLVHMKADKISIFRVSSNGDIFSGVKGAVQTGGADLAERYTSPDALEPGEVVTIDYTSMHGVRRSTYAYQADVLGVVSSNPGFVAGAFTKDSYPVALIGRVPVKISTENGPVVTGDRLVSSSIPGVAAKAAKAGRTIGIALETLDATRLTPCEKDKKKLCGTVMMFINLSDYQGPVK